MPKVSIITINYNNCDGLEKTIPSVLSQTFTDYEYILIDGGSTDGSLELIKSHADKIAYWVSEKDAGIYDAMNKGIAVAKGEYCLFLNSGDYLYQTDVLQQVADLHLSADICYSDLLTARDGVMVGRINSPEKISLAFLLVGTLPHQAQFIKRALFEEYGNYADAYKMCADWEFVIRVFFKKKPFEFKHIAIPVAVYDLSGFSSNPVSYKLYYTERKKINRHYFPVMMSGAYSAFVALIQSGLFNNSFMARSIQWLRKYVLRRLGEETISKG